VIAPIEHGQSVREIATNLGCRVTTVHRRVDACGD
jgi:DNA-directed RNA polymerase specialized sigma24 family protein